jgi:hypothetical protein
MSRSRFDGGDHKQDADTMSHITLGTQRITERSDPPEKSDCPEPRVDKGALLENVRTGGMAQRGKRGG